MKKVKMLGYIIGFVSISTFLVSCGQIKRSDLDNPEETVKDLIIDEDQEIKNNLIGNYFYDDKIGADGLKIKNITGTFEKNGSFQEQVVIEKAFYDFNEPIEIQISYSGNWDVKDKFLIFNYDSQSLNIYPEEYNALKGEIIELLEKRNNPDRIIYHDLSKVILQSSNGDKNVIKKSF